LVQATPGNQLGGLAQPYGVTVVWLVVPSWHRNRVCPVLLKMLIAFGGRDISQATLADELWPDAEGDAARRTFDSTLHRLRKMLPVEDILVLADGKLSLNARRCWVDIWAFEHHAREALSANGGRELSARQVHQAEVALTLYQGRFLAHETLPGIELRAQRYADRYVRLSLQLGRHYEDQHARDAAVEVYSRALEMLPTEERIYQALIRMHIDEEQHNEALRLYRRCEAILGEVLGQRPGKLLRNLISPLLSP